jgi:hypothetical protein
VLYDAMIPLASKHGAPALAARQAAIAQRARAAKPSAGQD